MSRPETIEIVDVVDERSFHLPPCADGRFDHRSCDYWEDGVNGSKLARPAWWRGAPARPASAPAIGARDNPFAPPARDRTTNPFAPVSAPGRLQPFGDDDVAAAPTVNPFAPPPPPRAAAAAASHPKLRLLKRGEGVFGSYAKVLRLDQKPIVYAQFGPLSAFPRARHLRDLYPRLPLSPLPAVITCIATAAAARGRGFAMRLVAEVCTDLAGRGFAAVEVYPDLTLAPDETSTAHPAFWRRCGFSLAVDDERFPVMRQELG